MKRLSFIDIFLDANRFVWHNRVDFLAMAYMPVAVLSIFQALLNIVFPELSQAVTIAADLSLDPAILLHPARIASMVVSVGFTVIFSVAWCRAYFMLNANISVGDALKWQSRNWRFLGRFLARLIFLQFILLSTTVVATLTGSQTDQSLGTSMLVLLVVFAGLAVHARTRPWQVAAAIDHSLTMRESMAITKKNSWSMFWLGVLPGLPTGIVVAAAGLAVLSVFSLLGLAEEPLKTFLFSILFNSFIFGYFAGNWTATCIAFEELTA